MSEEGVGRGTVAGEGVAMGEAEDGDSPVATDRGGLVIVPSGDSGGPEPATVESAAAAEAVCGCG